MNEKRGERRREREGYGGRGDGDNESERACRDVGHHGGGEVGRCGGERVVA